MVLIYLVYLFWRDHDGSALRYVVQPAMDAQGRGIESHADADNHLGSYTFYQHIRRDVASKRPLTNVAPNRCKIAKTSVPQETIDQVDSIADDRPTNETESS